MPVLPGSGSVLPCARLTLLRYTTSPARAAAARPRPPELSPPCPALPPTPGVLALPSAAPGVLALPSAAPGALALASAVPGMPASTGRDTAVARPGVVGSWSVDPGSRVTGFVVLDPVGVAGSVAAPALRPPPRTSSLSGWADRPLNASGLNTCGNKQAKRSLLP